MSWRNIASLIVLASGEVVWIHSDKPGWGFNCRLNANIYILAANLIYMNSLKDILNSIFIFIAC
jgi:hypothetical protein